MACVGSCLDEANFFKGQKIYYAFFNVYKNLNEFLMSFSKNCASSLALPTYHYKSDGQLILIVLGWDYTRIPLSYFNE